jgi:uncharacterized membrane protein YbhN (UPF0104 family)
VSGADAGPAGEAPSAAKPEQPPSHHTLHAIHLARGHLGRKALKLLGYAVVAYLILRLIPSLESALTSLERMNWQWLAVAFALELVSETGFVLSWRSIVDPEDTLSGEGRGSGTARRLAWVQLGGGMFVPGGSLSSVGVGTWLLHRFGMPVKQIAERQLNLQLLNTGVDALALIGGGVILAVGVLPGRQNGPELTVAPAAVAVVGIAAALWIAAKGKRYAQRGSAKHPKVAASVSAASEAVEDTRALLTHRVGLRSVLGAVIYLFFDVLVLWSAFVALGTKPLPSFAVVLMAYIIGALGGSLPLPAGIGAVLGMVGMLVLYGVPHNAALAAVIVYQAIGQLVPLVGGGIAWVFLRFTIGPLKDVQQAPQQA